MDCQSSKKEKEKEWGGKIEIKICGIRVVKLSCGVMGGMEREKKEEKRKGR